MQFADHRQAQRPPLRQHLRHAPAGTDKLANVRAIKTALFHDELDESNRVGGLDGVMLGFIRLDERCQYVEPVAVRRPGRASISASTSSSAVS